PSFPTLRAVVIAAPPRSPLSPYTPLFRSPLRGGPADPSRGPADQYRLTFGHLRLPFRPHLRAGVIGAAAAGGPRRASGARRRSRDRKSTRLNSSHVSISYAVFCLTKKTN